MAKAALKGRTPKKSAQPSVALNRKKQAQPEKAPNRKKNISKKKQRGAKGKLQKIKALRGTKLIAVIAVSGIIGFWLLSSIISSLFFSPPKRPIIAPVQPKIVKPVEEPPEIKPWERLNNPTDVFLQCRDGINALIRIMPPGWKIGGLSCGPSGVTTFWTREVGRISWIDKALNRIRH